MVIYEHFVGFRRGDKGYAEILACPLRCLSVSIAILLFRKIINNFVPNAEMKYTIKSYGIAKDIVGNRNVVIETNAGTVGELRSWLATRYPSLTDLRSLFIAVNQNYAADDAALKESDEIVLIPPVSGG